jgi:hypothetical protein
MAGLDTEPLSYPDPPHDGQARCRVCATGSPEAGHEWCDALSGLVCADCCQTVLLGDLGRLLAMTLDGRAEPVIAQSACARCERGQRWFAGHVLGVMTRGTLPS